MSEFLDQVKKLRPDISDWVVHFTQGQPEEAKESLRGILNEGLKNGGSGICFTESPICHFSQLFSIFKKYPNPRFAPYGVAVKKEWLFGRGGRPVIYLPAGEKQYLKAKIEHLFEEFEPNKRDFTWQREWRCKDAVLPLSKADTVVIVPNVDEAYDLAFDYDVEYECEGRGMEPSQSIYMDIDWPFVTLEAVRKLEGQETSDERIIKLLRDLVGS
jgi:hypothetical protein